MSHSSENESSQDEAPLSGEEEEQEEASSSEGEEDDIDLDASATESDEAEESDDDDEEIDSTPKKSQADVVTESILQKYQERHGKQLYIRFPHVLPAEEEDFQKAAKGLSALITTATKPRQKHARFCLVDFKSMEDRDSALKSIRNATKTDPKFKGVIASLPRTDNAEFVKELAEKKLKSLENKKAKARVRKASKVALRAKNFTSSIVLLNLPKSASLVEVRKLFPNSVDIQIKPGKGKMNGKSVATITLPSTLEARAAVKQKLSLAGTQLNIRFDTQKKPKKPKSKDTKQKPNTTKATAATEVDTGATTPTIKAAKKSKKSKAPKATAVTEVDTGAATPTIKAAKKSKKSKAPQTTEVDDDTAPPQSKKSKIVKKNVNKRTSVVSIKAK